MSWLSLTIFAYFLNSLAMVIDKTLLKREVKNPFVYTFYVAALGALLMIVAIPIALLFKLELIWPGYSQFGLSLLAGATFSIGLLFMFSALKREDASRLIPMIGGLTPIFVLLLAYIFINEQLTRGQIFAFILIIIGTFIISLEFDRQRGFLIWFKQKITGKVTYQLPKIRSALLLALQAAILFGLSYALTKDVYNHQPFVSGFVWTRLGAFLVVLLPIISAQNRRDLFHPEPSHGMAAAKGRFLFGQFCGGSSALLLQYAISLASVSLIQALQGIQYVFVFIAVLIGTYYFPKYLKEELTFFIVSQKILAISLIGAGIYLLIA